MTALVIALSFGGTTTLPPQVELAQALAAQQALVASEVVEAAQRSCTEERVAPSGSTEEELAAFMAGVASCAHLVKLGILRSEASYDDADVAEGRAVPMVLKGQETTMGDILAMVRPPPPPEPQASADEQFEGLTWGLYALSGFSIGATITLGILYKKESERTEELRALPTATPAERDAQAARAERMGDAMIGTGIASGVLLPFAIWFHVDPPWAAETNRLSLVPYFDTGVAGAAATFTF